MISFFWKVYEDEVPAAMTIAPLRLPEQQQEALDSFHRNSRTVLSLNHMRPLDISVCQNLHAVAAWLCLMKQI
jgi:hypothetical protein